MRFSIRGMLLLTATFATLVSIGLAWRSQGAVIGPALLVVSFTLALILAFVRRPAAKLAARTSLIVFCVLATLYLSMGPASWIMARYVTPCWNSPSIAHIWIGKAYSHIYTPIATNAIYAPNPVRQLSFDYVQWWMPRSVQFKDMGKGMGWSDGRYWYTVVSY